MGWFWRRFLAERETFLSIVVFGFLMLLADIFADLNLSHIAMGVRVSGLVALLLLGIHSYWRYRHREPIAIPLLFTTRERRDARSEFERFQKMAKVDMRVVRELADLSQEELVIRLERSDAVKNSHDPTEWKRAWERLLGEWEREVESVVRQRLRREGEWFCYHLHPHLWLPLAFALGASVNLRRSIVLYHAQEPEGYLRVMDLTSPRRLFESPPESVPPPEKVPENWDALTGGEQLILHLGISDRHELPAFSAHPDHKQADKAALVYRKALRPDEDWLGHVQWLYKEATPLLGQYRRVDLCLTCPSAIAFALGMAFSRTPNLWVCQFINSTYYPVFSLQWVEERLSFD